VARDPAPAWLAALVAALFIGMGFAWLRGWRVPSGTSPFVTRLLGVSFVVLGVLLGLGVVLSIT
jgi:hypothetical protein